MKFQKYLSTISGIDFPISPIGNGAGPIGPGAPRAHKETDGPTPLFGGAAPPATRAHLPFHYIDTQFRFIPRRADLTGQSGAPTGNPPRNISHWAKLPNCVKTPGYFTFS